LQTLFSGLSLHQYLNPDQRFLSALGAKDSFKRAIAGVADLQKTTLWIKRSFAGLLPKALLWFGGAAGNVSPNFQARRLKNVNRCTR
jgi:hypothetical protein